jgi:hypothetical protein
LRVSGRIILGDTVGAKPHPEWNPVLPLIVLTAFESSSRRQSIEWFPIIERVDPVSVEQNRLSSILINGAESSIFRQWNIG